MSFENLPKCERCGEPYAKSSPKATRARFCTSTCKKYAWNERNPDAYHKTQVKRDEKRKIMRKESDANRPRP
jgi:hypothetical protein